MEYLILYLLVVNAAGFLLMLADKRKAKKKLWRVPEKVFFILALFGGSIGCFLGMYTFRHKTKHLAFTIGIPAVMIAQAVIGIWLLMGWPIS